MELKLLYYVLREENLYDKFSEYLEKIVEEKKVH